METHDIEAAINPLPRREEHIVALPGHCGGKPHVAGHRIKVQHVAIWHERQGKSPDEIVAEHPGVTLADVYAALAYYYDHRTEIDDDIRADERFASEMAAKSGMSRLVQRLSSGHGPSDPVSP